MRRAIRLRDILTAARPAACALALAASEPGFARGQAPGPETFAVEPRTPLELWGAVDDLARANQPEKAASYLAKFNAANPGDAAFIAIRNRYGEGSILNLLQFPALRPAVEPLLNRLYSAVTKAATDPATLDRAVASLGRTPEERAFALERLREAGAAAVPYLVGALQATDVPQGRRDAIGAALGGLDDRAVPPLIAALEADAPPVAAAAASALGQIGDPKAITGLTALAARPDAAEAARDAARGAVAALTGRPFESQPRTPVRLLAAQAKRYLFRQVAFPGPAVQLWSWDGAGRIPVARAVRSVDAGSLLGLKAARAALAVDPADAEAQDLVAAFGLVAPPAAGPAATPADPAALGRVLRATADSGRPDVAAAAAAALGKAVTGEDLGLGGAGRPLAEALASPDRRVRFAAARALVELDPKRDFPGSTAVVPILAQFAAMQRAPRAVIIDGNNARAGQLAGLFKALGYEPRVAASGDEGFRDAAEGADVEVVVIEPDLVVGPWTLVDTLTNLRADSRTAGVPVFVVGSEDLGDRITARVEEYPGVERLITPMSLSTLRPQLLRAEARRADRRGPALVEAERVGMAREAVGLLGRLSRRPDSPFAVGLDAAAPALIMALHRPETEVDAAGALAGLPDAEAQRCLADALLDPLRPAASRRGFAEDLARSVKRFGPRVGRDREARLVAAALGPDVDPAVRPALVDAIAAMRPVASR